MIDQEETLTMIEDLTEEEEEAISEEEEMTVKEVTEEMNHVTKKEVISLEAKHLRG